MDDIDWDPKLYFSRNMMEVYLGSEGNGSEEYNVYKTLSVT